MKTKLFAFLLLCIILTACKNKSEVSVDEKANIYYNEIINTLDKNDASDIKIMSTKRNKYNEELILYTYYSNEYENVIIGIKNANWIRERVEFMDLTKQKSQHLPISFGSVLQNNKEGKRTITYGIINDNNIKNIKILYADSISIEEEVNEVGFIIIRDSYNDGIIQITAYDKYLNEVYKFPDNEIK